MSLVRTNDFGIAVTGKHSLTVDIMGCRNAYLFLSNISAIDVHSGNYYEILLGGSGNGTTSIINDGCFSCKSKAKTERRVLDCASFKTFTVTWNEIGSLQVREGTNMSTKPLMSSSHMTKLKMNYLHLISPGQKVVWRIYVECSVLGLCPSGSFGPDCTSDCGHCKYGTLCHEHNGRCAGCEPGWTGERCDLLCSNGTYGDDCKECGKCLGGVCDTVTGVCTGGCVSGWSGDLCQEVCPPNLFGENCTSACGHCACGTSCNFTSGVCPQGCLPGWKGDRCDKECSSGFYGQGCKQCGHCKQGSVCDKACGACPRGCASGWTGDKCNKPCRPGTYGVGCQPCGHCQDGTRCDAVSGNCPVKCEVGWTGARCDQACAAGKYGDQCRSICGHCVSGTTCDPITGGCPTGCSPGWRMDKCDQGCPHATFGEKCTPCGQCKGGRECDKVTGDCRGQCKPSWTGNRCDRHCDPGTYGDGCKLCGQCKNGAVCHSLTGQCPSGCERGWGGPRCDQATACPRLSNTSTTTPQRVTGGSTTHEPTITYDYINSTIKITTTNKGCVCMPPTTRSTNSVNPFTSSSNITRKSSQIPIKTKESIQSGYISTIVVLTILVPFSIFTTVMWCRSRPRGKPIYYDTATCNPFDTRPDSHNNDVSQFSSEL
ncbi:multiple epidermal growth factor-like domains protein 10 [Gigantopelta aegis]|uniref:multiple epidermal growth factor-like domains protein 10 n=1 Tax=Gigantopelta aegis TaxID=1735272 RepID=UPI001B889D66|nr:multiple epidermal growth factor-like domains protein 10 [Gigantopelta aegis]